MANKSIFKSAPKGKTVPPATTVNRAGGIAYALTDRAALAQYAATGTFNDTFYSTGQAQVEEVLDIAGRIDVEFIGKVALYARESGRMKDMPALLCAHLASRGPAGLEVLKRIFHIVIDNGKMLRNFVQIVRSGATGRKSLGTAPKNLVAAWFTNKAPADIFRMSVGNDPSLADVLYISRSKNGTPEREALYRYMLKKEYDFDSLPPLVKEYEALKKDPSGVTNLPKIPFEMLMGLPLGDAGWALLADQASWTQTRMNLNTFSRHGVFKIDAITRSIAAKLKNPDQVKKAKPFPYQLLITYLNTAENGTEAVPRIIRDALHDALDISVDIVPTIDGPGHALIDVSGSMSSAVTGSRAGATSKARCIDVAALIGSMFLRRNKESSIIAYSDSAITNHGCESRDSVMTNAKRLASIGGGGTNLGAAFKELNKKKAKGDLVVVASDMETWADGTTRSWGGESTVSASAWSEYKTRNPKAKLVCINLQAGNTCQVANNTDVLNIGGFSDSLWEVIQSFVEGKPSADHWVDTIEKIQLPAKA